MGLSAVLAATVQQPELQRGGDGLAPLPLHTQRTTLAKASRQLHRARWLDLDTNFTGVVRVINNNHSHVLSIYCVVCAMRHHTSHRILKWIES